MPDWNELFTIFLNVSFKTMEDRFEKFGLNVFQRTGAKLWITSSKSLQLAGANVDIELLAVIWNKGETGRNLFLWEVAIVSNMGYSLIEVTYNIANRKLVIASVCNLDLRCSSGVMLSQSLSYLLVSVYTIYTLNAFKQ